MSYSCDIIADSLAPNGVRLTTMVVRFPRFILAEFNTHRTFSRNSASSRAIPSKKLLKQVHDDPFVPEYWGKLQHGMHADSEIDGWTRKCATAVWNMARFQMSLCTKMLNALNVHKQIANRPIEPFEWHTVIVSATDWSNFFALRDNPEAQPEMRTIAHMMHTAYEEHQPTPVAMGEWHLPLIQPDELDGHISIDDLCKISAGRCARVSYLTHDGKRDPSKDIDLYENTLASKGHMSALEHVATPLESADEYLGNFRGWKQLRKTIPHEDDFSQRGQ